ncbi:MAG: alpha-glucuronidase [Treponema sp.]|nr:alpha-glucuronidase [Treponema sp.]
MDKYSLCWLDYKNPYIKKNTFTSYSQLVGAAFTNLFIDPSVKNTAIANELKRFFADYFGVTLVQSSKLSESAILCTLVSPEQQFHLDVEAELFRVEGSFVIQYMAESRSLMIASASETGLLYGAFHLIRLFQQQRDFTLLDCREMPHNPLRLINHWDNMDGSVERGYAGRSIFFENDKIAADKERITDYGRLLASVGINGTVINNVNVKGRAPFLITSEYLKDVAAIADILRPYGIRLYLSVNFMSPVLAGNLETADPLAPEVFRWWQDRVRDIYAAIPDFGGFLVKADSEYNPGPHTYGRSQAEGANMLARALGPHGGTLIWRAFVYKLQDWRDTSIDRARAAYDIFQCLDDQFDSNVILQIKNGPLDFQVREPVSPLFGKMRHTNQMLELQAAQEYTGQQIDLCYLAPQWKEILDFDPRIPGKKASVSSIINGSVWNRPRGGMAAVSNIGRDYNWTGHWLAQANWYAFGRLAWDPSLDPETIAREWVLGSLSNDGSIVASVVSLFLQSWQTYEQYTTPFGLGWMVTPGTHYGPSPEGYEYSIWGTYHRADTKAIGVDRTRTGTGYTAQYYEEWAHIYDSRDTCPENLILFFHRLPYTYRMKNGKTLIQNYYDAHFKGYEAMREMQNLWLSLKDSIDPQVYREVAERFTKQEENARQWRDVINSYFYRKSGIPDEEGRTLY